METSLAQRLQLEPVADVEVEFDNAALPWHTMCVGDRSRSSRHARHARRRDGAAGVVVHSARVTTIDGRLADRFALTDRLGRKLDDAIVRHGSDRRSAGMARVAALRAGTQHSRNTADPRGKRRPFELSDRPGDSQDVEPGRWNAKETGAQVRPRGNSRRGVHDAVDGRRGVRPGCRPGRHAGREPQHAVGGDRGDPGHLHAGGVRPRRDRLLPGQARRPRRQHELRHLRARLHRLLLRRLPAGVRRLRHAGLLRRGPGRRPRGQPGRQ